MIDLLLDRLRWPATLVRERAASTIGEMLVAGNRSVCDALLTWINQQQLESLAAIGLLPFLYAAARRREPAAPTTALAAACRATSMLSEMFLNHLDSSYAPNARSCRHSGQPPQDWRPTTTANESGPLSFEEFLARRLEEIDHPSSLLVCRQYEYEKFVLGQRFGESPREAVRAVGRGDTGYYLGWQTLSDEIVISAYLRTLAWAKSEQSAADESIRDLVGVVSPIDLGLWTTSPSNQPDWWPDLTAAGVKGSVESQVARCIRNVQNSVASWANQDYVLLAASGCLAKTDLVQHELEIRSFFQRPDGPERPDSPELFKLLHSTPARVYQEGSPLRFEGPAITEPREYMLADWLVVPGSGTAHPNASMTWQSWRGRRGIQSPSAFLSDNVTRAVCRSDSIEYVNSGGIIARWSDWCSGLSALTVWNLPPATGWNLLAPRGVVDGFCVESGMRLAWSWEVASHFRDTPYGSFKEHRWHEDHGASQIILV